MKLLISYYWHRLLFRWKYSYNRHKNNKVRMVVSYSENTYYPMHVGEDHVYLIEELPEGISVRYNHKAKAIRF